MKKMFRSFAFWFVVMGLLQIWMHQIGQDSKSIVLISLNPILRAISRWDAGLVFMNAGLQVPCDTIARSISIRWYVGTFVTFAAYGLLLDGVRALIRRIAASGR